MRNETFSFDGKQLQGDIMMNNKGGNPYAETIS